MASKSRQHPSCATGKHVDCAVEIPGRMDMLQDARKKEASPKGGL
jgi:hypothetical protein